MITKVMMVDDDASIRRVGEIVLSRVGGWGVISCSSAQEALNLLDTEHPDLILLDVMMPVTDGITAFPLFKSKTKGQIPIIFMTAKIMSHETRRYTELGAAGVIAKPFEPSALPAQLEAIVSSYHSRQSVLACT